MTYNFTKKSAAKPATRLLIAGAGIAVLSMMTVSGASAQTSMEAKTSPAFQTARASDSLIQTALKAYKADDMARSIRYNNAAIKSGMSKRRKAVAYNNLCAAHASLGEIKAAVEACETALSLRSEFAPAVQNLAILNAK